MKYGQLIIRGKNGKTRKNNNIRDQETHKDIKKKRFAEDDSSI